ncbi:hypothetical protein PN36_07570 [Candidatus Thiomargarita nelsonii]|uniref:Uncharacterized protein n=1 Tax=Candidatus Thiomargarita nelsonii TaxID=1003181 RepID=A0A0A6PED8_9GAMM|nr:hypothetical protein PN36_07570 [Candidatus Thiomargarita nelsonii]
MIIRKNPILQTIAYVVMLCWGLSFSLSCYATSETMTYYAFVMYKAPSDGSTWELPPKDMETLKEGHYRFQIVRLRQEVNQTDWIALRGEFKFIPDDPSRGGVKLSEKETLDGSDEVNVTASKVNSIWLKTPTDNKYSWEKAGQPWVQPLIDEMKNSFTTGAPDPNFMRFLVLKKQAKAKSKWEKQGKKYTLYRLHYFSEQSLLDDEHLKALSRFIDPNQAPITEIKTLKKWIGAPDSFEKAGYLGQADERHKEFYKDFQAAFNGFLDNIVKKQAQKYIEKAEDKIKEANSSINDANEQIAKAEKGYTDEANDKLDLAETALNTAQAEIDKAKGKIDDSKIADVQNKFDEAKAKIKTARQQVTELGEGTDDISTMIFVIIVTAAAIFLLVMLLKNLKDGRDREGKNKDDEDYLDNPNHLSSQKKPHSRKRGETRTGSPLKCQTQNKRGSDKSTDVGEQNDPFLGTTLNQPIDRGYGDSKAIPSLLPSADYVLKHDLDKMVENQALAVLSTHFPELLQGNIQQLQNNQDFKNIVAQIVKEQVVDSLEEVKKQVVDSLNEKISDFVVKKVESTLAKRPAQERTPIDDQPTPSLPSSDHQEIKTPTQNMGRQTDQTPPTKQPNKVVENLKTVLTSMSAVDKAEIEHLETTTDTCTFVTQVVAQCLELNQPITFYQRLNKSIQDLTDKKVSLILPNEGDDINQEEHKVASQQTVTKGRTNVIASVVRPGVRCDGTVKRKAEVVQNT